MEDPMELAKQFTDLAKTKKDLEVMLGDIKRKLEVIEPVLLQAIEEDRFPQSSRVNGMTVYLKREVWASPKDGDYEKACEALRAANLGEYVHERFNTNSVSAYVRDLEREGEPLPPILQDALNVTEKFKVQARAA